MGLRSEQQRDDREDDEDDDEDACDLHRDPRHAARADGGSDEREDEKDDRVLEEPAGKLQRREEIHRGTELSHALLYAIHTYIDGVGSVGVTARWP